jgi:hypothetical protein
MLPTWSAGLTLERRDFNGNYCKSNCLWIPKQDQAHNRRDCVHLTFKGETLTLGEWARKQGISQPTVSSRHACNWPVEAILFKANFMTLDGIVRFSTAYPEHAAWAYAKLPRGRRGVGRNSNRKDGRVVY